MIIGDPLEMLIELCDSLSCELDELAMAVDIPERTMRRMLTKREIKSSNYKKLLSYYCLIQMTKDDHEEE